MEIPKHTHNKHLRHTVANTATEQNVVHTLAPTSYSHTEAYSHIHTHTNTNTHTHTHTHAFMHANTNTYS